MNLSDIQAECSRLLADVGNNRWSAAVLTTRANLAQVEVQGYTNAVKSAGNITLVQGTSGYTISANILDILRIQISDAAGNVRPLTGITREQLDFLYPTWQQYQSGAPLWFYWNASDVVLSLVPAPDYSLTNGVVFTCSRRPADLSGASDIPFDAYTPMVPYHMSIVHWVVAQCFMDDGTPEALAKSKFHKSGNMMHPGEYEKQIGRIISEFDVPENVPNRVMFKPQGGRIGSWMFPNKSNPLSY